MAAVGTSWIIDDTAPNTPTPTNDDFYERFWEIGPGDTPADSASTDFSNVDTDGYNGVSKVVEPNGSNCSDGAQWQLQGVPSGTYEIQTFIPQSSGLTTDASYDFYYPDEPPPSTIDQATDQGQWITLTSDAVTYTGYDNAIILLVDLPVGASGTCDNGTVIFDAVRFTLLSENG